MTPKVTVEKRGPGAAQIRTRLERITGVDVLVGITAAKNQRRGDKINNAYLLYILTNGSPALKIPATPVIEPAIEATPYREEIAKELAAAASSALEDPPKLGEMKKHLGFAGTIGRDAAKAWFVDPRNNWPPNAPSTIRRKGSDRRNIDTGALRRAITYVVRQNAQ